MKQEASERKPKKTMVELNYNDDLLNEQICREQVAKGWHAAVCVDAAPHIKEESGNISIFLAWRMLQDPDNVQSITGPMIRQYIMLPVNNTDYPNHKPPKGTAERCARVLSSMFDDVYAYPAYDKETKIQMYRGEPTDDKQVLKQRVEAFQSIRAKLGEIWGSCGESLKETFVGVRQFLRTDMDGDFVRIEQQVNELPENEEICDEMTSIRDDLSGMFDPPDDLEDEVETPKRTRRKRTKKGA